MATQRSRPKAFLCLRGQYCSVRPGVANLFHKWAKILIKKVQGAKFLIKNFFGGQTSAILAKIAS